MPAAAFGSGTYPQMKTIENKMKLLNPNSMKQPFRPARMALASSQRPTIAAAPFVAPSFNRRRGPLCVPGGKLRKFIFSPRDLFPALVAALNLSLTSLASAAPLTQAIEVSPNPLILGDAFTLTVTTASNVVNVSATMVFHPDGSELVEVPLTNRGSIWSGSGVIPENLRLLAQKDEAKVKVLAFDSQGKRDTQILRVNVQAPVASASFAGGILTLSGDNQDNQLIVSRDAAGNLRVNGGAVPITGGPSTISN